MRARCRRANFTEMAELSERSNYEPWFLSVRKISKIFCNWFLLFVSFVFWKLLIFISSSSLRHHILLWHHEMIANCYNVDLKREKLFKSLTRGLTLNSYWGQSVMQCELMRNTRERNAISTLLSGLFLLFWKESNLTKVFVCQLGDLHSFEKHFFFYI